MSRLSKSDKSIQYTIILIIMLAICFATAFVGVNKVAEVSCAEMLGDIADNMALRAENSLQCNVEELEVVADLISSHHTIDAAEITEHLNSFKHRSQVSSLAVLLPDDEIIYPDHPEFTFDSIPSFESEKALAPYISERSGDKNKYIYFAQPLFLNESDDIGGILYGFVDLSSFSALYSTTAYNGQCQEYIIDGNNGDFIMDTWHEELGNVSEFGDRETKTSYVTDNDLSKVSDDIARGVGGYVVFRSETSGEFFHSAYRPVGNGRFSVMVMAPESVVFAKANKIKHIFLAVAVADIAVLSVYFFVLLAGVRKRERKNDMQLVKTVYMYGIQKTLFEAYKNPNLMVNALKKTAEAVSAEGAILVSYSRTSENDVFVWHSEKSKLGNIISSKDFILKKDVIEKLKRGETVTLDGGDIDNNKNNRIINTLLTPVLDNNEELVGILGVANLRYECEENVELLKAVSRDFMMALRDMEAHNLIVEMGTIDTVTRLKNRAVYQDTLKKLELMSKGMICCVYIDADGLHDLNNSLGHAAGDTMLRYVGAKLKAAFGEDTFRIGGDEFIAFLFDATPEKVEEMIRAFTADIKSRDYSVSIGYSLMEAPVRTDKLVRAAEREMYAAKHRYYSERKDAEKAREMNAKLERTLLEKKDSDNFLKIIASYFLGVYVVNLATDNMRTIYVPDYFEKMLRRTDFKFSKALRLYADKYVVAEDSDEFLKLFDYSTIERTLADGYAEIVYNKPNGDAINVKIFRAEDYSPEKKETFWLFELHNNS